MSYDKLWHGWLRHCATSQKVAGSIPEEVIGIFHRNNPSGRTKALGSTESLTEMSTRNIYRGKGGRCIRLITLPSLCADCPVIWELQLPEIPWACNRPVMGLLYLALPVTLFVLCRGGQAVGREIPFDGSCFFFSIKSHLFPQ